MSAREVELDNLTVVRFTLSKPKKDDPSFRTPKIHLEFVVMGVGLKRQELSIHQANEISRALALCIRDAQS